MFSGTHSLVTTIRPQLGVIEYPDLRQVSVADLPGLIEGAHINVGMGYQFLKHVERTRLLLLVVDLFGFALSHQHDHRTCLENVYALNKELELYDKELLKKPCMLLVNKMDVDGSQKEFDIVKEKIANLPGIRDLNMKRLKCTKLKEKKTDVQPILGP